jgi:hypothetical protein
MPTTEGEVYEAGEGQRRGFEEVRILHQGARPGAYEGGVKEIAEPNGPHLTYEDQGTMLRGKLRELVGEMTQVAEATLKHARDVGQLCDRQRQMLQQREGQLAALGREMQRLAERETQAGEWFHDMLKWVPDDFDSSLPEEAEGFTMNRFTEWHEKVMGNVTTMLAMHFEEDRPAQADIPGWAEWEQRKRHSWAALRELLMGKPSDDGPQADEAITDRSTPLPELPGEADAVEIIEHELSDPDGYPPADVAGVPWGETLDTELTGNTEEAAPTPLEYIQEVLGDP